MKKEFNVKDHEGKNLRGKIIKQKQAEKELKEMMKLFFKAQERIVD